MQTEVAISPQSLFLKDSDRKTLDKQQALVNQFADKIGREVAGVTAVLGSAPDYAELTFSHLAATGKRLFGIDYEYNYTRTTSSTSGSFVAIVGHFNVAHGLNVYHWAQDDLNNVNIWAAPLVVPTPETSTFQVE